MTIVKRATLKHPNRPEVALVLARIEKGEFRWRDLVSGAEFDRVGYLSESDAVRALRTHVDHDPEMVGVDLTISAIDPTPEQRAAEMIHKRFQSNHAFQVETDRDEVASIIAQETNIGPLVDAASTLLAYVFRHRPAFALALFPATPDGQPRDLVMDGLLLNCIEELAKTTGQDFSNLLKPLKEPVSKLVTARGMPRVTEKGKIIQ